MKGSMKRLITPISTLVVAFIQLATGSLAIAQSDEEKEFLSMYFTDEELVVQSTTRSPKPVSQIAENITVVTAADIELMNAHTVADVLNTVTGVEVYKTGGPGQIATAFIQGSEMRHVTVVIDGVVLNGVSENSVDLGMMPVQNIEKIEIIKGPASSAWGSALGGVINIITKTGTSDNKGGLLSASYGTENSGDFRVEGRGKQDKVGYYLTAGRLQSDGLTPHFDVSENNGYAKLTYDITDKTEILFTFGYDKDSRGTGVDTIFDYSYENSWEIIHSTFGINSVLASNLELNVSFRTLQQTFINGYDILSTGTFIGEDKLREKGYGSSAKLTWKNEYQTIVFGADYDSKTLDYEIFMFGDGDEGLKKSALYVNDTITLDKFAVTPGVRYDHTDSFGNFTSPSLGLTYALSNTTILRAYAAKGFSNPALLEAVINPDLKAETVWSYQVGAETGAIKNLWIKMSGYRNEMRDVLSNAENVGKQRRQGLEASLKTAPVYNLSLTAGAEYIDAKDLETGERLQDIPTSVYDLGIRYDNEHVFRALLRGRYIDWNAQSAYNGKYGSFIVDFNATKKIYEHKSVSMEAFLNVNNLFNGEQYLVYIYPNPERWYEAGIRCKF